jgi:protein-disulfide isomerase
MPTVDAIVKKYPAQVRVVYRHLPLDFHRNARMAAEASMEAFAQKGDAGFWKFVGQIHGKGNAQPDLSEKALMGYARSIGADPGRLQAALELGTHQAAIQEDERAAATAGISGTPAFTVNGYFVSGAQAFDSFDRLIRRSLSESATPKPAIAH